MENIKEEKAREYAENIYLPEQRNTFDFRMCKKDFEAGFEAGKQERDREIIEKLGELITFMEGEVKRWENHADKDVQSRNTGYLGGLKKAMRLIENLSK